MKKKVIAAGHICLDITPVFPGNKVSALAEILTPGKLINVGSADVHTGGSVANTGLAMKLLGADVSLMGKIGNDVFGDMIRGVLKNYGAESGMLISGQESTSYSVVIAVPGIDRVFLHNPGANDSFCAEDIPQNIMKETALFHFGYPPLMKSMFKNDGAELVKIMKRAKSCGAATSLDFASIDPDAESGKADWESILKSVIPYVDFLVPSVEELCYMLDKERFFNWQSRALGSDITQTLDIEKDIEPLAEKCMGLGAKVLLIKCGAKGMYYRTASKRVLMEISDRIELDVNSWADKEGFEISFVPDRILSGTGAGDTSIAAFLVAALEGYSMEDAVHLAAAEGACCVAAYDALSGLRPLNELKQRIDTGWEKTVRQEE